MPTSADLRKNFLSFFKAQSHTVKVSDSLIPSGDPTVLFTSAGMNQFKDYFLGKRTDLTRAASSQKCLRTGDLDNVGKTPSHHSFFEMLGNFSFGDYFKPEAIRWGWEFLTGTQDFAGKAKSRTPELCLPLPAQKLWVSIYEEDEEAFALWRALGVPENRIKRFDQKDNFWPSNAPKEGPNGPCGPCSEIYFDADGKVNGQKSVEVWNLVFTQFDRQPDGSLKTLPKGNIDTGMGLERLTRVVQGVETDYETDLFMPIVAAIRSLGRGQKAKADQAIFAERSIADHLRAIVFLIAEGLLPSNESRGYVLRMLIRRAHRLGRAVLDLGEAGPFLSQQVGSVIQAMHGSPYTDMLVAKRDVVERAIAQEERQFSETLQAGTARLDELIEACQDAKRSVLSGDDAFTLYDTHGFPLELTIDIAQERGLTVDRVGFDAALKAQQERSRAGSQFTGGVFVTEDLPVRKTLKDVPVKEEQFIGYGFSPDDLKTAAVIQGLWDGTQWVQEARENQTVGIVLNRSPFYGEAGGQIGDAGRIQSAKGSADVVQTTWANDVLIHHAKMRTGRLKVQEHVTAQVDHERRLKVSRSHTATHLLHWALRTVLGPEAVQGGSYNEAERLRFDFSSLKPLQDEQRHQVELLVHRHVGLSDPVRATQMGLDQARQDGALALFGEKYGSTVRVVTIGDYSKELCGGTHLPHTGLVGGFRIMSESSIAAGTRRIEAVVGETAAEQRLNEQRTLQDIALRLGRGVQDVVPGLEELLAKVKWYEKELKTKQAELARVEAPRLAAQAKQIGGVRFVTSELKHADREVLAALADAVKTALRQQGVVLLASGTGGQAAVVVAVTDDVAGRVHAGQLLKAIAPLVQGSGGGRPEFAQGGGKDPAGIPAALKRAEEILRDTLESARA